MSRDKVLRSYSGDRLSQNEEKQQVNTATTSVSLLKIHIILFLDRLRVVVRSLGNLPHTSNKKKKIWCVGPVGAIQIYYNVKSE